MAYNRKMTDFAPHNVGMMKSVMRKAFRRGDEELMRMACIALCKTVAMPASGKTAARPAAEWAVHGLVEDGMVPELLALVPLGLTMANSIDRLPAEQQMKQLLSFVKLVCAPETRRYRSAWLAAVCLRDAVVAEEAARQGRIEQQEKFDQLCFAEARRFILPPMHRHYILILAMSSSTGKPEHMDEVLVTANSSSAFLHAVQEAHRTAAERKFEIYCLMNSENSGRFSTEEEVQVRAGKEQALAAHHMHAFLSLMSRAAASALAAFNAVNQPASDLVELGTAMERALIHVPSKGAAAAQAFVEMWPHYAKMRGSQLHCKLVLSCLQEFKKRWSQGKLDARYFLYGAIFGQLHHATVGVDASKKASLPLMTDEEVRQAVIHYETVSKPKYSSGGSVGGGGSGALPAWVNDKHVSGGKKKQKTQEFFVWGNASASGAGGGGGAAVKEEEKQDVLMTATETQALAGVESAPSWVVREDGHDFFGPDWANLKAQAWAVYQGEPGGSKALRNRVIVQLAKKSESGSKKRKAELSLLSSSSSSSSEEEEEENGEEEKATEAPASRSAQQPASKRQRSATRQTNKQYRPPVGDFLGGKVVTSADGIALLAQLPCGKKPPVYVITVRPQSAPGTPSSWIVKCGPSADYFTYALKVDALKSLFGLRPLHQRVVTWRVGEELFDGMASPDISSSVIPHVFEEKKPGVRVRLASSTVSSSGVGLLSHHKAWPLDPVLMDELIRILFFRFVMGTSDTHFGNIRVALRAAPRLPLLTSAEVAHFTALPKVQLVSVDEATALAFSPPPLSEEEKEDDGEKDEEEEKGETEKAAKEPASVSPLRAILLPKRVKKQQWVQVEARIISKASGKWLPELCSWQQFPEEAFVSPNVDRARLAHLISILSASSSSASATAAG